MKEQLYLEMALMRWMPPKMGVWRQMTLLRLGSTAATPVATPHGEQAIGSLQAGEKVEAYNPNTGQTVAEPVQQVLINHDSDLLNLTIRTSKQGTTSPETIHTTDNHPWFTVDRGWVQAGQLRVGEQVLAQDGTRGTVQVLVQVAGSATMYNLSVAHVQVCDEARPLRGPGYYINIDLWLLAYGESTFQRSINYISFFLLIHQK